MMDGTYGERAESGVDLRHAGRGVERVTVVVGNERGESPVVGGVLEDVHDGHGGVGEAVDEDGLEEALRVVGDPAYGTEPATFSFVSPFRTQGLQVCLHSSQ